MANPFQFGCATGFSTSEKEVLNVARAVGISSPVLFAFIPRKSRDELLNAIAAEQAAEQTLNARGVPSTPEGQLARRSMESRHQLAKLQREALVSEVVSGTKAFQGGGNELLQLTLEEKLRAGADASLARLFPRFKEADFSSSAWEGALRRARDGADQPFSPLGYQGPIEQHPVCKQVLTTIGSSNSGAEVRKELERSPYGWSRDAVDAGLIALHRSQHVTATLNGVIVPAGQLDQNKISKSEFRVETITLSVQDRLALAGLYKEVEIPTKPAEVDAKVSDFFGAFKRLAQEAGGDPPLPTRPSLTDVEDIEKLGGNERLAKLRAKADDLKARIAAWKKTRDVIGKRLPAWQTLERLMGHARVLSESKSWLEQLEAIRTNRRLIADPDPIAPVLKGIADLLRQALNAAHGTHELAYKKAAQVLADDAVWAKVSKPDQARILKDADLEAPAKPDLSSDQALLASLDAKSLAMRRTEAEAISARLEKARQQAAQLVEPKIQFVSLDRPVLKTEADIDAWLTSQRKKLIEALKNGPVQVQ